MDQNRQKKLETRIRDAVVVEVQVLDRRYLESTQTKNAILVQSTRETLEKGRLDVAHPQCGDAVLYHDILDKA